jgi:hypothetical protein
MYISLGENINCMLYQFHSSCCEFVEHFRYIAGVSFIGGVNGNTTGLSQVTDKLYHIMLCRIPPPPQIKKEAEKIELVIAEHAIQCINVLQLIFFYIVHTNFYAKFNFTTLK